MAKLLSALAAALLLSGPAFAGPQKEAAVPAAPSAHGMAVAPVPALGLALGETGSAASLDAPAQPGAAADASSSFEPAAMGAQAGPAERARSEPAPAGSPDAAGETLADAENARFDNAASLPGAADDAAPMPIAARMHALVPPHLRPSIPHPALVGRARLVLAEQATRKAGGLLFIAAAGLGAAVLGGFGLAIMLTAAPFAMATPSSPRLRLPAREQRALQERVRGRVGALLEKLALPGASAPEIVISNIMGRHNMSVTGSLRSSSRLYVGEDWAGITDAEMDGVLAHELGHLHRRDSRKDWARARELSNLLGLWALAVTPVAGALAWAYTVAPAEFSALDRLLGGWAMSPNGPALLAGFVAAAVGAAALLLAASRLRERLADDYAVRLAGAQGLIAFFERMSRKPAKLRERLRARFWGTHPRLAVRLGYLRRG